VAAAVPVWGDTAAFVDYVAVSPLQVVPYAMSRRPRWLAHGTGRGLTAGNLLVGSSLAEWGA